jgi:hypothetical protein
VQEYFESIHGLEPMQVIERGLKTQLSIVYEGTQTKREDMPRGEVAVRMNAVTKPAYKHGGYTFLASGVVPCDKCPVQQKCDQAEKGSECKVLLEFQELKVHEIMALPHVKPEDELLVRMLVRELALQAVIAKFIAVEGMIEEGKGIVSPQPVMKIWYLSINVAARLCEQLGLTPLARSRLKMNQDAFSLIKRISEVKEKANSKETAGIGNGNDNR